MACWWMTTPEGQAASRQFVRALSRKTQLKAIVINAWIATECGQGKNNPLGVSPGGRNASYRTLDEGIKATVATLNNGRYGAVLRAARINASAVDQLKAIASSPWATDPKYQTKLLGNLASFEGVQETADLENAAALVGGGLALRAGRSVLRKGGGRVLGSKAGGKVAKRVGPAAAGAGAVGVLSATGWLDDLLRFIGDKAALALVYVVLTLAAGVLFVLGLFRVSRVAPGAFRSSTSASSQSDDIPF